ncbi:MAG TPA: hypothetical protein VJM11_03640 [Nevskiaceae bacterium]|nr:hypothetical protein [Nevskiaceae bacterium]
MIRTALALSLAWLPLAAHAQQATPPPPDDERPALQASPDDLAPEMRTPPPPKVAGQADKRDQSGSTIIGERESPIGLYITPWRNAYAEQDIDRPARLLQVDLSPVDRVVFSRQVEYFDALSAASKAKAAPKAPPPAVAPPPPAPPTQ